MQATIEQLARLVDGIVDGDGDLLVAAARPLDLAGAGDISFLESDKHLKELEQSHALAVVVPPGLTYTGKTLIRAADPLMAFVAIYRHLHDIPVAEPAGIDPRACVSASASIGEGATISPFAYVGDGAIVGVRCNLGPGAVVGRRSKLGDDVTIHANAVLYDRTVVGQVTTSGDVSYRARTWELAVAASYGRGRSGGYQRAGANAVLRLTP